MTSCPRARSARSCVESCDPRGRQMQPLLPLPPPTVTSTLASEAMRSAQHRGPSSGAPCWHPPRTGHQQPSLRRNDRARRRVRPGCRLVGCAATFVGDPLTGRWRPHFRRDGCRSSVLGGEWTTWTVLRWRRRGRWAWPGAKAAPVPCAKSCQLQPIPKLVALGTIAQNRHIRPILGAGRTS